MKKSKFIFIAKMFIFFQYQALLNKNFIDIYHFFILLKIHPNPSMQENSP